MGTLSASAIPQALNTAVPWPIVKEDPIVSLQSVKLLLPSFALRRTSRDSPRLGIYVTMYDSIKKSLMPESGDVFSFLFFRQKLQRTIRVYREWW